MISLSIWLKWLSTDLEVENKLSSRSREWKRILVPSFALAIGDKEK
jgi:hypothetical protein